MYTLYMCLPSATYYLQKHGRPRPLCKHPRPRRGAGLGGGRRRLGYFWKLGLFTSRRLLAIPKGSMLSVSRGEEKAPRSPGPSRRWGSTGLLGSMGRKWDMGRKPRGLNSCLCRALLSETGSWCFWDRYTL